MNYNAIVIGVSAGGISALSTILPQLPGNFPLPVIIVQHISPNTDNFMVNHFNHICQLKVKEADEKESIQPGTVYFAPPNYHLLVETDFTFSLSVEERVNFSRPSIDVLFESAADAWHTGLIGIILTGASTDGSKGMRIIKKRGGYTIAQDPQEAEVPVMPEAAIKIGGVDRKMTLSEITTFLLNLQKQ
ncbi:MAG TPA: chemotaxis protein CheB [Bacteroidales bacterium]|nr:chemotaxis protein CheB [Bacteroidales bacterium]HPR56852.1 chemotaxis protein CheB [Bacteroidales bacterium]HRW96203.1 chemotaxis protein CheB [Bacteroidales bacterium]